MLKSIKSLIILGGLIATASTQTHASWIAFEQLPSENSTHESHHNSAGPILADDFIGYLPAGQGTVTKVEWWGTASSSDDWELTFHNHNPANLTVPNIDNPFSGGLKHMVTAAGMDADGDGIWHYKAEWNPQDWKIYLPDLDWFSVANISSGWEWALADTPTIGGQIFDAVRSTGGVGGCTDGGPHCGPWQSIRGADFAFRVTAVPEPGTILLLSVGLLGLARCKRISKLD